VSSLRWFVIAPWRIACGDRDDGHRAGTLSRVRASQSLGFRPSGHSAYSQGCSARMTHL
jgi:hypothetical protein